jgi:hypothetical protein
MSDKKLYRVTVEFTYYAHVEDRLEALGYAAEALSDSFSGTTAAAQPVPYADSALAAGWGRDLLIYSEDDITLGEALDLLPKRGESQ